MMDDFVFYDRQTGQINGWGSGCPLIAQKQETEKRGCLIAKYPGASWMVADGVFVVRPSLSGFDKKTITADGLDVATMIVPVGCVVNLNGENYVVDDETLEIAASYPGLYVVKIDHWPFMPFEEALTCV